MGIIRKTLSLGTLGAVDFRSDKERTAAYTKGARKALRKQNRVIRGEIADREQRQADRDARSDVVAPPPGWYGDPYDRNRLRWWNGSEWTEIATPRPDGGAR